MIRMKPTGGGAWDRTAGSDSLETAISLSLFCDARHPQLGGGFWADLDGALTGSTLWTLMARKLTPELLPEIDASVSTALAWLRAEGVAESVTVESEIVKPHSVGVRIEVRRPLEAPRNFLYSINWVAQISEVTQGAMG